MKTIVLALVTVLGLTAPVAAQTSAASADWGRFYGRAEYLLWWMKDSPTPVPLVTNGSLSNNRVFLGGDDIDVGHSNGMRLTLGYWFTDDRVWGIEASGFYFPSVSEHKSVTSPGGPGSPLLAVPFFNPVLGAERISNLSGDSFSGAASEKLTTRLWGADGNMLVGLSSQGPWRMELLAGFRYLRLGEQYSLETTSPDLPPGTTTLFATKDIFETNNDFYGGQIGLRGRYQSERWTADATLKVAVGAMRQSVDIAGSFVTNFFAPPNVATFAGGYFSQPSNIGSHSRDVVAVVPELGINVGFRLTNWASIVAGYTFLYASNILRPGKQIDRTINVSQAPAISLEPTQHIVGPARPAHRFEGSDFWAHGLSVGLALSF